MFGRRKSEQPSSPDAASVWRWKGVLANSNGLVRSMVGACLLVEAIALTFMQMGFMGIGMNGDYSGYLVVLLQPLAAVALLLGTGAGGLFGLTMGAVLVLHAVIMPLNSFELVLVKPISAIVPLALTGLALGVCFAKALRSDMSVKKRFVRIVLICLGGSCLYSILFILTSVLYLASIIVQIMVEFSFDPNLITLSGIREMLTPGYVVLVFADIAKYVGLGTQVVADALLMVISCALADAVARRAIKAEGGRGLRSVFNGWLAAVVFLAFMVMTAGAFVIFTVIEYGQAEREMSHLLDLISAQANDAVRHDAGIDKLLDAVGFDAQKDLTREVAEAVGELDSTDDILNGFTASEDGVIFVLAPDGDPESQKDITLPDVNEPGELAAHLSGMSPYLTDTDEVPLGVKVADCLDSSVATAICESLRTGRMQRITYTDGQLVRGQGKVDTTVNLGAYRSPIAFLYARECLNECVIVCIRLDNMVFADRGEAVRMMAFAVQALFVAVLLLITRLLDQVVVRPIHETNSELARITTGDLSARAAERDTREFASLSNGINETVDAMKAWIEEAETRMDAELETARAIQEAALPRTFPPFPEILHFDVYASMEPARQVGGDFYDFFLIGDDSGPHEGKLGFVVADVSGKGVPAALFMMAAKTQIRDYLQSGMEPGEAIENANRQLCSGNDAGMFVTAFAGVLDYRTGHLEMVNAGHNPPLQWQHGAWTWLRKRSGLPLGLFDGVRYRSFSADCLPGDQLLLYTDGVTEAMNVDEDQYGEDRLETLVKTRYDLHPRALVEALREDVAAFTKDAEQSDDITVMALEVGVPPELTANLTVFATLDELDSVNRFIHTELDRRLCPVRAQNQLDVAVEELFVNVCNYAYPDATPDDPGKVWVSYTYCAEPPSVTVDIVDEGVPFDPLAKPDAVTPHDIMDVPVGGLGILMAKKSVDSMQYERTDGTNMLRIVKSW